MLRALSRAFATLTTIVALTFAYLVTLAFRGVETGTGLVGLLVGYGTVAALLAFGIGVASLIDHWRVTRLRAKMGVPTARM